MPALKEEYIGEFTEADVDAWREGDWYFVTLDGKLIYARYTRDESFTHAAVLFRANRSPRYPRTLEHLDRPQKAELLGDWNPDEFTQWQLRNAIKKEIRR